MLLATEPCFGILGRKQGRNPEASSGSVHLTYQLVFLLPPMLYREAHESPVRGQKGEGKGHKLRKTLALLSSGGEKRMS